MSDYNAKNYTEQGGETTVIGGTLAFGPEAKIENFPGATEIDTCSASDVEGLVSYINDLVAKLKTAGVLK